MQIQDIIVLLVILILVALALFFIVRNKKRGNSCSGGCAGCSKASGCSSRTSGPDDD